MSLFTFLERLERQERKAQRERKRVNVRAYRKRKQAAGYRRIEIYLDAEADKALGELMLPGETMSDAVSRLVSGYRTRA